MSDIVKWDPFKDVTKLYEDIDNLFTQFLKSFSQEFHTSRKSSTDIALVVENKGTEIVITGDIPNAVKDSIDVAVRPDNVVVSGETSVRKQDKSTNGYYWSKFARMCSLPARVKSEEAIVSFENGKLVIRVPKVTPTKSI